MEKEREKKNKKPYKTRPSLVRTAPSLGVPQHIHPLSILHNLAIHTSLAWWNHSDIVEGPSFAESINLGLARGGGPGGLVSFLSGGQGCVLAVLVVGAQGGFVGALVVDVRGAKGAVEAVDGVGDVLALAGRFAL